MRTFRSCSSTIGYEIPIAICNAARNNTTCSGTTNPPVSQCHEICLYNSKVGG